MVRDIRSLVWLASYPKSGNTWLRAFLGNYLFKRETPLPLDELKRISSGDCSAAAYAAIAKVPPQTLRGPKLMEVRMQYLRRLAQQADISLVKTHCANTKMGGVPLIPAELTKLAIYLIRDPRDMLLSYADHFAMTPERAASSIASRQNGVPGNAKVLGQFLGTWSDHVRGWTRAKEFRVLVLRYEDMLANPEEVFRRVVQAMGAPLDTAVLRRAVAFSSFETLARLEAETGFEEKGTAQERFFREGRAGRGREVLPPEVAEKIREDHGDMMRRHGYL